MNIYKYIDIMLTWTEISWNLLKKRKLFNFAPHIAFFNCGWRHSYSIYSLSIQEQRALFFTFFSHKVNANDNGFNQYSIPMASEFANKYLICLYKAFVSESHSLKSILNKFAKRFFHVSYKSFIECVLMEWTINSYK